MGSAQVFKDFIKIHIVERTRLLLIRGTRALQSVDITRDLDHKKKFLFNTQYINAYSDLEFLTAAQLQLRGHEVVMLICDGLPYSEREIVDLPTVKSYKSCSDRTVRYCKAYGLKYIKINSFLNEKEKRKAQELSQETIENLESYQEDNINLGDFAKRNHSHYFKGDIKPEGAFEAVYRKAFESASLIATSLTNILSQYKGYELITANGKFIQSGIPIELIKNTGKSFYTYEVFSQGNGVIVDKDQCSLEQSMTAVWEDLKHSTLSDADREKLYHSFDLQQKSQSSIYDLWDENRIEDEAAIIALLGIDIDKKIIACYPNVYWDSVHMGVNAVSENLTQWLIDMVDFAASNENIQLVIRTHPAEVKVFDIIQSKFTMSDTLHAAFNDLPSNVIIIEPSSDISSYSVARIADANVIWNGTIGLELALRGIKPIVIADAYYSQKGFTTDFLNFKELTTYLLSLKEKPEIDDAERTLAELFCYHVRFNRKFNAPFFKGAMCYFYNYSDLVPGKNKVLDNMTDFFLDNHSYLNIGNFDFE